MSVPGFFRPRTTPTIVTSALARTDNPNSIRPMRMPHGNADRAAVLSTPVERTAPRPDVVAGRSAHLLRHRLRRVVTSLARPLPALVRRPQEDPVRPSGPSEYSPCLVVSQVRQDLGHHEVPLGPGQPGRTEDVGGQLRDGPGAGRDQVPPRAQPPAFACGDGLCPPCPVAERRPVPG